MVQIIRPDDGADPMGPAGLGRVPTLGGVLSTTVPDPVTGMSDTRSRLSEITTIQAIAQAIVIPPPPYQVINRIDPSGSLTIWFRTLIRKLGGYTSTPADDALVLQDLSETVDQRSRDEITALQQSFQQSPHANKADALLDMWEPQRGGQWVDQLNPVLPKQSGKGIRVDLQSPSWTWRDMKGTIDLRTGGAMVPTRAVYQGSLYAFKFDHATAVQEAFTEYHFDHDYVMATDVHIHTHWSTIIAATGDVNWLFDLSYGKGYNQGPTEGTAGTGLPVTLGVTQAGGSPFYYQIAEVICSAPGGLIAGTAANYSITSGAAVLTSSAPAFTSSMIGLTVQVVGAGAAGGVLNTTISAFTSTTSVTLADNAGTTLTNSANAFKFRVLDSNLFEPDGLIQCRTWHQTNRAADTLTQIPFLHYVDCHYQSTNIGTKQRNGPAFWT